MFVCPESKSEKYYKNGMKTIPDALKRLGYDVPVEISKRYRRHFNLLLNQNLIKES